MSPDESQQNLLRSITRRIATLLHRTVGTQAKSALQTSDSIRSRHGSVSAYRIGDRTVIRGSVLTSAGLTVNIGEPVLTDTTDLTEFGRSINALMSEPAKIIPHPKNQAEWQLLVDEHKKIHRHLRVRSEVQLLRQASLVNVYRTEVEVSVLPMRKNPNHKSWIGVVERTACCPITDEDIGRTVDRLLSEGMLPVG